MANPNRRVEFVGVCGHNTLVASEVISQSSEGKVESIGKAFGECRLLEGGKCAYRRWRQFNRRVGQELLHWLAAVHA